MKNSLQFLGTGASLGVPVVGCHCDVCCSKNVKNRRLRPSALLTVGKKKFLFDASPDFRYQALQYKIDHLDAVFLTHLHFDHVAGFDDLRIFYFQKKKPLLCICSCETFMELTQRFHYLFQQVDKKIFKSSYFLFHLFKKEQGEIEIDSLKILYFSYYQREVQVMGFRLGDFAYMVDIRSYDESIFEKLKGVKTLVLSVVRQKKNAFHLGMKEILSFGEKTGAEKIYLTHISHELEHEKTNREMPSNFSLAYDGQEISLELTK